MFSHISLSQPRLIAIASHKGGAGRTTLALNIAALLSAAGHKSVVADLDPRQNALQWALHTPLETESFKPLNMVISGLAEAEEEGSSPVAELLRTARTNAAEVVVADLSSQPDYRSMAVLRAADLILIPASNSALDADLTAATIRSLRDDNSAYMTAPRVLLVPILNAGEQPSALLRAMGLPLTAAVHRDASLNDVLAPAGSPAAAELQAVLEQALAVVAHTPSLAAA